MLPIYVYNIIIVGEKKKPLTKYVFRIYCLNIIVMLKNYLQHFKESQIDKFRGNISCIFALVALEYKHFKILNTASRL